MAVKVASCTLAQLFSDESITSSEGFKIDEELAVPEYQRPYRWTEVQFKSCCKTLRIIKLIIVIAAKMKVAWVVQC